MRKKDLSLVADIEPDLPTAVIDRERLRVAMGSLLENAILYTPTGGAIEVKVYQDGRHVVFSVTDTGVGISAKALPYIFSKFYRAKEAVSLDTDRAGLGLSVAQEITARHGGKLEVTSEGRDRGTHAELRIPVRA